MKLLTLPNLLSFARLPLAAAFVLTDTMPARIAIVSMVAITDLADGYFARRMRSHDRTTGQLVDPITDKLFVLIALFAFAARRELSSGSLLLLIMRDIFISVAFFVLWALDWKIQFRARLSGKAVTILQLASVFALVFWRGALRPLDWATAVFSAVAIADYTRAALRQRRALAAAGPDL